MKTYTSALFTVLILLNTHIDAGEPFNIAPNLGILDCPCPQLYAHRGASGNYPDSTMLAFEKAKAFKADVLELDVHLSSDGHIMVAHDASLLRTTGKDALISDLTLSEIKALDAGFNFQNKQGHFLYRGQGLKVLTFSELYQAFPNERFNIELKADSIELAEKMWTFIRDHQLESRTIIASGHSDAMEHYRSIKSDVALTSASTLEVASAYMHAWVDAELDPVSYQVLQIPHNYLTKGMVDFFHANNLVVQVWTVNETEDIDRMLEIGVDAIMTDYPERAFPLYRARGLR